MTPSEKYYRSISKDRSAWAAMFDHCFICLRFEWQVVSVLQTHEIVPKSALPNSWWHRCNALYVCTGCHTGVIPMLRKNMARQLSLKMQHDRNHFDLEVFNEMRLRGGGENCRIPITFKDVEEQLDWMQNNPEWWR